MDDWSTVAARRMARQGLAEPLTGPDAVVRAVRLMCGAHAQMPVAGEHSVARRVAGATRADVQGALADGDLVRTYGPRSTVHLLPAADLPRWTGALGSIGRGQGSPAGADPLDASQLDVVVDAVGDALAADDLTVTELDDALRARLGAWAVAETMPAFGGYWPRWRQALTTAAHRGVLCFGPPRGRTTTYTDPARRHPGFAPATAAQSVPWLVEEYRRAYGPSAPEHLARWLAVPAAWAREAWDGGDPGDDDGGDAAELSVPDVVLLPHFDAYVVAAQPREELFRGRAAERALTRGQAGNVPVVLLGGRVGGVWHRQGSGARTTVTVELFRAPGRRRRAALEAEVDRIGAILGTRAALVLGEVTVGPHA